MNDREYLLDQSSKAAHAAETVDNRTGHSRGMAPEVVTVARAAALAGVTPSSVQYARSLMARRPDLFALVKARKMTLGQAQYAAYGKNHHKKTMAAEKLKTTRSGKPRRRAAGPGVLVELAPQQGRAASLDLLTRNLASIIAAAGGPVRAAALADGLHHGLDRDKLAVIAKFLDAVMASSEAGQAA